MAGCWPCWEQLKVAVTEHSELMAQRRPRTNIEPCQTACAPDHLALNSDGSPPIREGNGPEHYVSFAGSYSRSSGIEVCEAR